MDERDFASARSPEGRAWADGLPTLIESLCRDRKLTVDQHAVHVGYHAVVVPVSQGQIPRALKLTWPLAHVEIEAQALANWNGVGMVQLIDIDPARGALLLERLDPVRSLNDLPLERAAFIAGQLIRRLAIPAPNWPFPLLSQFNRRFSSGLCERQRSLGFPIPAQIVESALSLSRVFASRSLNRMLIHHDLHYGNVLAGSREAWLAIDPRPIIGEPEFSVPELLWTRVDELDDSDAIRQLLHVIVTNGGLDADRARHWAIIRCVDYWLWGLEHGLTEDPKRCARILAALA